MRYGLLALLSVFFLSGCYSHGYYENGPSYEYSHVKKRKPHKHKRGKHYRGKDHRGKHHRGHPPGHQGHPPGHQGPGHR